MTKKKSLFALKYKIVDGKIKLV